MNPLEDRATAANEGWGLFECSGDGMIVIDRDNDTDVFASGEEAYAFVLARANAGSAYHIEALKIHGTV